MNLLDLNLAVESSEPFEGAMLRVWAPAIGELAVLPERQILARKLNRRYTRLAGWFRVVMPPDWELPAGQMTRFLVMLHGSGGQVVYCMAWGKAVLEVVEVVTVGRELLEKAPFPLDRMIAAQVGKQRVEFESHSPIFELPTNLDPDQVAAFEFPFLEDPTDLIALVRYHDYLWEHARKWVRFGMVKRALKQVAKVNNG